MFPTRLCAEGWYFTIVLAFIVVAGSMPRNPADADPRRDDGRRALFQLGAGRGRCCAACRSIADCRSRSMYAGEMLTVELEATSPSRLAGCGRARHAVRPHGREAATPPRSADRCVPAGPGQTSGRQSIPTDARAPLRTAHDFGPLRISTRYPFGLMVQNDPATERADCSAGLHAD